MCVIYIYVIYICVYRRAKVYCTSAPTNNEELWCCGHKHAAPTRLIVIKGCTSVISIRLVCGFKSDQTPRRAGSEFAAVTASSVWRGRWQQQILGFACMCDDKRQNYDWKAARHSVTLSRATHPWKWGTRWASEGVLPILMHVSNPAAADPGSGRSTAHKNKVNQVYKMRACQLECNTQCQHWSRLTQTHTHITHTKQKYTPGQWTMRIADHGWGHSHWCGSCPCTKWPRCFWRSCNRRCCDPQWDAAACVVLCYVVYVVCCVN